MSAPVSQRLAKPIILDWVGTAKSLVSTVSTIGTWMMRGLVLLWCRMSS